MEDFKVGDKVQICEMVMPRDGVIVKIIPSKNPKPTDYWNVGKYSKQDILDFSTFAEVKWDNDGSLNTLNVDDLDPQDSAIEREFRNIVNINQEKIKLKLKEATRALQEACDLSNKFGIPFYSNISFLAQAYKPASLDKKFPGLDLDLMGTITDVYNEYDGWEHSEVC